MSKPEQPDRIVRCIHCDHVVVIPGYVKPYQIWVGRCGNGHAALYSYPPPTKKS